MNRTLVLAALLSLSVGGLTACAPEAAAPPVSAAPDAPAPEPADEKKSDEASGDAAVGVMPPGARPASAEFPFPVPEGWEELYPFTEEKIGKKLAMSASYGRPDDAAAASEHYQGLLKQAGFQVHPNLLGEQVHDASFIAEGPVNGVQYSGTLNFDTDSEGTSRVAIDLIKS